MQKAGAAGPDHEIYYYLRGRAYSMLCDRRADNIFDRQEEETEEMEEGRADDSARYRPDTDSCIRLSADLLSCG